MALGVGDVSPLGMHFAFSWQARGESRSAENIRGRASGSEYAAPQGTNFIMLNTLALTDTAAGTFPTAEGSATIGLSRRRKTSRRRSRRDPHNGPIRIPASGNRTSAYQAVKRGFDIAGALTLLVVFSPLMFATFCVLFLTTRGRPFFSQTRVGECGRLFPMFKFRTMRLDADKMQRQVVNEQSGPVFKNRRDPRITRIGRTLRSTSIDEMPQLFNVLLGHMSLVGPRPPVPKEVVEYKPWQRRRLSVKPGLTCLWQVSGRCEIGFEDWVRMDIWYTKNQNLATDLKLLWQTPKSVLSRRGAY